MTDIFPPYKSPGGHFSVADYNALVRAIRRATPQQGPGTRVSRSEGGSLISVPERRFSPVRVSDDSLYPFKLSVVNAATPQNPSYRYLVYIPGGSLYCSGVEGSCVNQLYGSEGWRRIGLDTDGAFVQDGTEYPIYLLGRFAYATEDHKAISSATYVITTNPDPRYVSALGEYDSENVWRYYACKIGTMTRKGVASQLVCGSIVFMVPAGGGEGGGGGTQAAFEVRKTASGQFIVYLPPGCFAYKNISVGGTASLNHSGGGAYTFTDADRELFTVEDENYWYYVANGYNGATSGDIYLQAAYSSGSVTFAVVFGSSRVDGVGSNAGTGSDDDNYQKTLIAIVSGGKAHQVVHSAVRFYGSHGTLSASDKQQLKEELEAEVEQAGEDAQEAATAAAASASAAAGSATSASGSASSAATSATNAATSETNASDSATAAAGSATTASGAASSAAGSAAAAASSATAASGSASTASTKAGEAASSASDAASSASDAADSASDAAQSASDADGSVTAASNAAMAAAGSASAAAQSASSASGSASSANTSAQAATTAALNANSSATDAAGSASDAAGSASDAAGSASDAAQSASDAAQSAADAAQSAQDAADAVSQDAIADAVDAAIQEAQQNGTIPALATSGTYSDSCYNSTELGTGSME